MTINADPASPFAEATSAALEAQILADRRRSEIFETIADWMADRRVVLGLLRRPAAERLVILGQHAADRGDEGCITREIGGWLCRHETLLGLLCRRPAAARSTILAHLLRLDLPRRTEVLTSLAAELPRLAGSSVQALAVEDELQGLRRRFDALEQAKIADEEELLELRLRFAMARHSAAPAHG